MEKIIKIVDQVEAAGGDFVWAVVDRHSEEVLWSHGQEQPVKSASLIKLFIEEVALDHQTERVAFRKEQAVPFSLLAHLEERTYRLSDLMTMMIALSDNTATNLVIDYLGLPRLSEEIAKKYPGTRLRRHMMDSGARDRGLENITTAMDVVAVLETLAGNERALVDLAEQHDRSLFLREVDDEGIHFIHKTGSLEDQKADAGILEVDGRSVIVVAILDHYPDPVEAKRCLGVFFETVYRCVKGECSWPIS